SDSNSETKSPELVSIVANDGPIISTENKSDIIDEHISQSNGNILSDSVSI
ncbi:unnamed protein product, partial [Rotaria sordida]